ncbi:MAG: hemolysin family protein [Victivallaceae bacterium]|nr:hemolysin family protein [Victivallaceae bacterium]
MEIFGNIFVQLLLLLVFLSLSAWFSGSETALFSLSRARLLSYRQSPDRRHQAISKLLNSYGYTLIVLIFGNMVVNIALTLTSDNFFSRHLQLNPAYEKGVTITFSVIALLFFGEIAPKTIALMHSHRIADQVALPVLFLRKLLFPLIWVMDKIFALILDRIGRRKPEALNSEEYVSYIEMAAAAGAFSPPEQELLKSVFGLRRIIAEEVMTARVNLAPIRVDTSPGSIAARIKEKKLEFYPIIVKDIDDSEFILSARDFFLLSPDEQYEWKRHCTFPAVLIPANVSLTQVLKTLNREKIPAALVVDEYGRTIGMISIKDIYTQLIGGVETIYDQAEYTLEKTGSATWIIRGMMPLFELEEAFGLKIPDEYESKGLNGLFGEILGRLPQVGDRIDIGGIKLAVQKTDRCRVTEIKVEKSAVPAGKTEEK